MIVADTSALVAVVFGEPEHEAYVRCMEQAERVLISAVSVVEARLVVNGRRGQRGVVLPDELLRLPMIEPVAVGTRLDATGRGLCMKPYAKRFGNFEDSRKARVALCTERAVKTLAA